MGHEQRLPESSELDRIPRKANYQSAHNNASGGILSSGPEWHKVGHYLGQDRDLFERSGSGYHFPARHDVWRIHFSNAYLPELIAGILRSGCPAISTRDTDFPHRYRLNWKPDANPMLRDEVYRHSVWLSPADANARGIKDGDLVLVYNDVGSTILTAYVTSRIVPGSDCDLRVDVLQSEQPRSRYKRLCQHD